MSTLTLFLCRMNDSQRKYDDDVNDDSYSYYYYYYCYS